MKHARKDCRGGCFRFASCDLKCCARGVDGVAMSPPSPASRGQPEPDRHRVRRPRETIVPAVSQRVAPGDGAIVAARLSVLVHELSNLLDGSLRCLDLALRDLKRSDETARSAFGPLPAPARTVSERSAVELPGEAGGPALVSVVEKRSDMQRRLDAVHTGLSQMASIIREFSGSRVIEEAGTAGLDASGTPSASEAVNHAIEVLSPVAMDHGIQISARLQEELNACPAPGLFGVVACAVRNAIESIEQSHMDLDDPAAGIGHIVITGGIDHCACMPGDAGCAAATSHEPLHSHRMWLEIADDGIGPPPLSRSGRQRVFDFGYTTKAGSAGIGLAVARDTITRLGGSITLGPRSITEVQNPARPGAVLRIECPFLTRKPGAEGNRCE